jgi:hypothetical protein
MKGIAVYKTSQNAKHRLDVFGYIQMALVFIKLCSTYVKVHKRSLTSP